MQVQLSRILEAIEVLRDVDTSHVGPTATVLNLENVMRDDEPADGLSREAALANLEGVAAELTQDIASKVAGISVNRDDAAKAVKAALSNV